MYNNFFGFKDKPFNLTSDPEYLFLSKCHEEAIAHLNYAVLEGEGFVEITGEVGTGKSMICRTFLENLDDNICAAYIFNPKLNEIQLLQIINDEFNIESTSDSAKELIDALNIYLMDQKAKGKKVIILIDEAQNLSTSVLEQLRLLSNLETTKEKLLQIVLVGQPELAEKLESYELRQLGQRVTLRYRISALTSQETQGYIRYRINIASKKAGVEFNKKALKQIYRFSGGIPRNINIICDRALLIAYGLREKKITSEIIKLSVRELNRIDRNNHSKRFIWNNPIWKKIIYIATMICIIALLAAAYFYYMPDFKIKPNVIEPSQSDAKIKTFVIEPTQPDLKIKTNISDSKIKTNINEPIAENSVEKQSTDQDMKQDMKQDMQPVKSDDQDSLNLEDVLKNMNTKASRRTSILSILRLWQNKTKPEIYLDAIENDELFFIKAVENSGLTIYRLDSDLKSGINLNLPMILDLRTLYDQSPKYLTLVRINKDEFILNNTEDIVSDITDLDAVWSGIAYIPWKNYLEIPAIAWNNASQEAVTKLKILLATMGLQEIGISPYYNNLTINFIKKIQKENGLMVDGLVGSRTKIVLYNQSKAFNPPQLRDSN